MPSAQRPNLSLEDIKADLIMAVVMVHGRVVADEIPDGVYHIAAECAQGEVDDFYGGVKALLCNLAGAVSDGDLMMGVE